MKRYTLEAFVVNSAVSDVFINLRIVYICKSADSAGVTLLYGRFRFKSCF